MRKSRTFESNTDRTGQEPDDFLNMSAAQRLRMIHTEKMSVPKAERKTPDAKADQLPLPTFPADQEDQKRDHLYGRWAVCESSGSLTDQLFVKEQGRTGTGDLRF